MTKRFQAFKELFELLAREAENNNSIEQWAETTYETYKQDIAAVAALVTILNYRCWDLYDDGCGDEETSMLYSDLYYEYNNKAWEWLEENGSQEEKDWYFHTMD